MAAPEKQTMNLQQICDRTSHQTGATRLSDPSHIKIWYNAEMGDPSCCVKYELCCACIEEDPERSYLYLREGAMEFNKTYRCCIGCCRPCFQMPDCVCLTYFDREPWLKKNRYMGCLKFEPTLEKVDNGYMCCCQKLTCHQACCGGDYVSYVPISHFCCCIPNKVNWCCNWCGLCGAVDGTPLMHSALWTQPKDVEGFVAQAKQVIPAARDMPK